MITTAIIVVIIIIINIIIITIIIKTLFEIGKFIYLCKKLSLFYTKFFKNSNSNNSKIKKLRKKRCLSNIDLT